MNRLANSWLLLIAIIIFPFAFAIGYNIDYSLFGLQIQGEEFEHKELIFGIAAGAVFLFGALKATRRWMGLRIVAQKNKFIYSDIISADRKRRISLYGILEIIFLLLFAGYYATLSAYTVYVGLVYLIIASEHIVHLSLGLGKNLYRIGLTKKALVAVDRESRVIFFSGLRKVSKHQQTLYFEYSNELVMHIPINMIPDQETFMKELRQVVNPDKVFFEGFEK
ncbi:MAG: hypothetical protein P8O07_05835 [Crocinitomicaceae bacterium]|nr:hypothetical protein [Crocinitomicaceae bacterium]